MSVTRLREPSEDVVERVLRRAEVAKVDHQHSFDFKPDDHSCCKTQSEALTVLFRWLESSKTVLPLPSSKRSVAGKVLTSMRWNPTLNKS